MGGVVWSRMKRRRKGSMASFEWQVIESSQMLLWKMILLSPAPTLIEAKIQAGKDPPSHALTPLRWQ